MTIVKPFSAIRPRADLAMPMATLPYDVMSRAEALATAMNNPHSFLHISRSEIDLPLAIDDHDAVVYQKAKENLDRFLAEKYLIQDTKPYFYIYRLTMDDRQQTGLVACTSVDDYLENRIKKHEFTRPVKEQDRINHFDHCDVHTEGVFLTYREVPAVTAILNQWISNHEAIYQFTATDNITHELWLVDAPETLTELEQLFAQVDNLYIADGHHRSASAAKVCQLRRDAHPGYTGDEPFNYFLAVIFPHTQTLIMDYNRVISHLNGLTPQQLLTAVSEKFEVTPMVTGQKPQQRHEFAMYLDHQWYQLKAKPAVCADDVIEGLDVSILQNHLLAPILGIDNPNTNSTIEFIGGIRGLAELEHRCHTDMAIAFALYPTAIEDVLAVADAGQIMPAKSTWFEPKLRSGLFIHSMS